MLLFYNCRSFQDNTEQKMWDVMELEVLISAHSASKQTKPSYVWSSAGPADREAFWILVGQEHKHTTGIS